MLKLFQARRVLVDLIKRGRLKEASSMQSPISAFCRGAPLFLHENLSVADAMGEFAATDHQYAIVNSSTGSVGILGRETLEKAHASAGFEASEIKIRSMMTRTFLIVMGDTTIAECLSMLLDRKAFGAIVLSADRTISGAFTLEHVQEYVAKLSKPTAKEHPHPPSPEVPLPGVVAHFQRDSQ